MRRINFGWMKARWERRHCDHAWGAGDRRGAQACQQVDCGVWRWFPLLPKPTKPTIVGTEQGDFS
jgi:hypothetical protein